MLSVRPHQNISTFTHGRYTDSINLREQGASSFLGDRMNLFHVVAVVAALGCGTRVPTMGAGVRPWKPAGISSPLFESHPAFDPKTGDLYFVRSSPQFTGWRILVSRCTTSGWSNPQAPVFAGDGVEADPYFTPDGRSLYFISTRSVDGVKREDLDIWRINRDDAGSWGAPTRLPEPVNSSGAEWFPRPAADGWLYFGSDRPGGFGGTDIWRARPDEAGRWTAENLGVAVNTAGDEYEPLPAPDGSRMILMADGSFYETQRAATGWTPRTKLGPPRSTRMERKSAPCSLPADGRYCSPGTPRVRTPGSSSFGMSTALRRGPLAA
jgi:hypothetical protein